MQFEQLIAYIFTIAKNFRKIISSVKHKNMYKDTTD